MRLLSTFHPQAGGLTQRTVAAIAATTAHEYHKNASRMPAQQSCLPACMRECGMHIQPLSARSARAPGALARVHQLARSYLTGSLRDTDGKAETKTHRCGASSTLLLSAGRPAG